MIPIEDTVVVCTVWIDPMMPARMDASGILSDTSSPIACNDDGCVG
ncbi:MAG TPA: hypothetical protein VF982_12325 [Anaerolineales bacterium]